MEQFQHIYENLKDHHEIAIVERYGENAKRFTVILISKMLFFYYALYISSRLMNLLFQNIYYSKK